MFKNQGNIEFSGGDSMKFFLFLMIPTYDISTDTQTRDKTPTAHHTYNIILYLHFPVSSPLITLPIDIVLYNL